MDSSSNTTEASYNLEFQLLFRQRRVNELLNEINELRRQVEPTDRIPYVVDNLINGLKRNIASQEDELGLLNQVVLSSGKPEAERAVREKLKGAIDENKALGRTLGMENMQRLHAERRLLSRERELLVETEEDMKRSVEAMVKQKAEAEAIIKKYQGKHGSIDDSAERT